MLFINKTQFTTWHMMELQYDHKHEQTQYVSTSPIWQCFNATAKSYMCMLWQCMSLLMLMFIIVHYCIMILILCGYMLLHSLVVKVYKGTVGPRLSKPLVIQTLFWILKSKACLDFLQNQVIIEMPVWFLDLLSLLYHSKVSRKTY